MVPVVMQGRGTQAGPEPRLIPSTAATSEITELGHWFLET